MRLGSVEIDESHPGATVIALVGEHDLSDAPQLKQTFAEVMGHGDPVLVVDLSRTDFLDSQVLHALVSARQDALERGQRLTVVCPSESSVYRVLEVTGLVTQLDCRPRLELALRAQDDD